MALRPRARRAATTSRSPTPRRCRRWRCRGWRASTSRSRCRATAATSCSAATCATARPRRAALAPRPLARRRCERARRAAARLARRRAPARAARPPSRGEAATYRELVSVWRTPELRAPDAGGRRTPSPCARASSRAGRGRTERMMRCDARTYLVDDILQKVDRATMSVGLEARNPLLDPDVVALALRSVRRAEARPGAKPLLREALRLELPDELVDRPKMGFGVPVGEWMRDGLRPLVEDLVLGRSASGVRRPHARAVRRGASVGPARRGASGVVAAGLRAVARALAAHDGRTVLLLRPRTPGRLLASRAGIVGAGSTGGAETQLFLIARALRQRGRRVALAVADVPRRPAATSSTASRSSPARPFGPGAARVPALRARRGARRRRRGDRAARGRLVHGRSSGAGAAAWAALRLLDRLGPRLRPGVPEHRRSPRRSCSGSASAARTRSSCRPTRRRSCAASAGGAGAR